MENQIESRADRLGRVTVALDEELSDILSKLCEEIQADLQKGRQEARVGTSAWKDSPAERELKETLVALKLGSASLQEAFEELYGINMRYCLEAPGKTTIEQDEKP